MSFVLGATLFGIALVFYVLQPILVGQHAPMEREDDEMTDAEARRRVTLLALRDVEYDRVTGKLDEEDYRELRRELSAEAIEALEAERAERGASALGRVPTLDALEAEIRRVRQGLRAGWTCRSCGHVNREGSRFCSGCGKGLPDAEAEKGEGPRG